MSTRQLVFLVRADVDERVPTDHAQRQLLSLIVDAWLVTSSEHIRVETVAQITGPPQDAGPYDTNLNQGE